MGTAVHVGVVAAVVVSQGFKHLTRLLAGGRVIEIDQRTAMDLLIEHREIPAGALCQIQPKSGSCHRAKLPCHGCQPAASGGS